MPPPLHVEYPVTAGKVIFLCSGEALHKMLGTDDVLLQGVFCDSTLRYKGGMRV